MGAETRGATSGTLRIKTRQNNIGRENTNHDYRVKLVDLLRDAWAIAFCVLRDG
jgi:hypothetical protein